ncbi:universal stress protein [Actinopolymorpha alba]|uniref:universal stress protein n=1 Tax=Actinopolymorpha alba TaxID=533267 RepID=UPI0003812432|nr:universal stress protein [Actinopolymorpha alba]
MTWQPTRTPIVVGVPGSRSVSVERTAPPDGPVGLGLPVRWAAREAMLRGVPLWLVHAYLGGRRAAAGGAQRAVHTLERTMDLLAAEYPELPVAMYARCGATVAALADLAGDAGLVVVGRDAHGRVAEAVLGSVGLSRRAASPVVAVPTEASYASPYAPIVVGVETATPAPAALDFAFTEGLARGVPVRFVLCQPSRPGYMSSTSTTEVAAALRSAVAAYRNAYPAVNVRTEVVDGEPDEVLIKESMDAGLLVLGPGRGWTAGWRLRRLGRVGHDVLRHSSCPVVLLRAADGSRGGVRCGL